MSNVVELVQPLSEAEIIASLREITDEHTTAVILITLSGSTVDVRTFGPEAIDVLIDAAAEIAVDMLVKQGSTSH